MSADWPRLLASAEYLGELYDGTGVTGLRGTGWGPAEAKAIELTVRDGEDFDVALGSAASGIAFRAAAARLTRTRAYLAAGNP